ncbi:unnamed protein product [Meloidogyne enterolobii]|uniref:Uncharacterized protein n=1 Tax=Meloidogyne enterolobii TaxID=390850 RepID=A0ACB1AWT4_MELEN
MFLQVYIVMFPENIYNSHNSVYSSLSGKYTKTLKNTENTIINASENTFNFNLIFTKKQTFKTKNMSKPNREQKTQQEKAQRFRNQVKYRSEAIQKGQYLLDENVIELMEQKRSGSIDNTSPVPMIDELQMKENNSKETMTSRRSMTTLPEMGRSFSTER